MPDRHALLGPSSASRWLACTPSARLEEQFENKDTQYSLAGTLAHSICELYARREFEGMNTRTFNSKLKKLKEDIYYDAYMLTNAQAYVEYLKSTAMSFKEKPFMDFEIEVDLSHIAPESFGTADSIMIGGDRLHITDFKNGTGVKVSAENNTQMKLYALGALRLYDPIFGEDIKRVTMAIFQPNLSGDASEWECSVDELKLWGASIRADAEKAFKGLGDFKAGDHCRFCKARQVCRARAEHYASFETFKGLPIGSELDSTTLSEYLDTGELFLSDADIGRILRGAKGIVEWYNDIKEYALSAILQGREIDGFKAVEGKSNRKWTDQDEAFQVLIAAGIQEPMLYERKALTLTNVEKLVGKKKFAELVGEYINKPKGAPTLVPDSDKRPAYQKYDGDEFEGLDA